MSRETVSFKAKSKNGRRQEEGRPKNSALDISKRAVQSNDYNFFFLWRYSPHLDLGLPP
jgi:hypothetical protein